MAFDFQSLAAQTGYLVVLVIGALIMGAVIGLAFWMFQQRKKWKKFKVIIWKRYKTHDGRTIPMVVDINENGMVKKDKKLNKWVFHLRKNNLDLGEEELANYDEDRELDIESVPYAEGGEVVFVEQLAKRKFGIGKPFVIDGNVKITVTSADLAEAMRSYDMNARAFGRKDHTLLAFAMYMVFAILVLVLIVVVLNKLEALQQFGDAWIEGAKIIGSQGSSVASSAPG